MFKLYVKFPQFGNDTYSKKIVDIEKIWNNIGHELCVYVNYLFGCSFLYFYIQSDIFRSRSSKMLMSLFFIWENMILKRNFGKINFIK